jgi:hypothetical protein
MNEIYCDILLKMSLCDTFFFLFFLPHSTDVDDDSVIDIRDDDDNGDGLRTYDERHVGRTSEAYRIIWNTTYESHGIQL